MNKSIVSQIQIAFARSTILFSLFAFLLGAIIPIGIFCLVHYEIENSIYNPLWILVFFGLCFSAKTVYDWGCKAFQSKFKAFGFVALVEGIMTFSHLFWLSVLMLTILVAVNGIATSCNLVMDYRLANRKKKA